MRLPNLEGYLKFPGPFPVASIRLKYVARGAAAARFVAREEDGAEPRDRPGDVPGRNNGEPDRAANAAVERRELTAQRSILPPLQGELELQPHPDRSRAGEPDEATVAGGGSAGKDSNADIQRIEDCAAVAAARPQGWRRSRKRPR